MVSVARAADPSQPSTTDAESARAGRVFPPQPGTTDDDPGTHPWSPDVLHSDVWPYDKPLQVPTDFCGPPGSFWLTAEFLVWNIKGEHLPPLVTAGPTGSGAVPGTAGVRTIFGGDTAGPSPYYGGRFTGGIWIDNDYTWAFEGGYFFIADQAVKSYTASAGQAGSLDISRPYINALTGQPTATTPPLASAGSASGYVLAQAPTEFQGAEGNFVWNLRRTPRYSVDVLTGFRYQDLGGELVIASGTTPLTGAAAGTTTPLFDQFSARNRFFGGQIGLRGTYRWHQLVLECTKKIALGGNAEDIVIAGTNFQVGPGVSTQSLGGLLTQPSNVGNHSHPTFSMVDELNLKTGWQICEYFQVFVGYNLIVETSVVRPADLVDFSVNTTQSTGGPARPAFVARDSNFWAQGLNVGFEIRY